MTTLLVVMAIFNIVLGLINIIFFLAAFYERADKDPTNIPEGKVRVFIPDGSEFEVQSYEFGVELANILNKEELK